MVLARALITDMDQWVKDGTPPPPNTYPKIAGGTLVPLSKWTFPRIPGVNTPHEMNLAYHLDFGSQWKSGIISNEPPKVGKSFSVLVPQTDVDGNDLGGVRLPELQVPLATYTGWNLRDPSIGRSRSASQLPRFLSPFCSQRIRGAKKIRRSAAVRRRTLRFARRVYGQVCRGSHELDQGSFFCCGKTWRRSLNAAQREWNEIAAQK